MIRKDDKGRIHLKLVFYGPSLGGKTTALRWLYGKVEGLQKGEFTAIEDETNRTLFFDFLPVDLGTIKGFNTRFHLYTVPGQVFYNASRKLILKGVDGIVFVADSQIERFDENIESFDNLQDNLKAHSLSLEKVPLVMQYNKRDLPNITSVDELQNILNPRNDYCFFEAVATQGIGVFETLKEICKQVLKALA